MKNINSFSRSSTFKGTMFSVALEEVKEASPKGLAFNNNGTKMYVVGDFGDDVNEYNLI